jgi:hypothetical protein
VSGAFPIFSGSIFGRYALKFSRRQVCEDVVNISSVSKADGHEVPLYGSKACEQYSNIKFRIPENIMGAEAPLMPTSIPTPLLND